MTTRMLALAVALAAPTLVVLPAAVGPRAAQAHPVAPQRRPVERRYRHAPAPAPDGAERIPGYGFGRDPRPNGGFVVDPYGNGNYTRGADGGFGGYPPGSDGAKELQNNQRYKCDFAPRTC